MAKEKQIIPVWGYKLVDGVVKAEIHQTDDGKLPRGWKDSPADLKDDK